VTVWQQHRRLPAQQLRFHMLGRVVHWLTCARAAAAAAAAVIAASAPQLAALTQPMVELPQAALALVRA
jgi:hypothetical protein